MMWGEEDKDHDTQRNAWKRFLLGGWFCSLWLRFIYQLRITETLGKHFLPIFKAIKHSLGFFLFVALCTLSVTQAYYTMGMRSEPDPFYAAFVQIFRLVFLGDFDLFEFEGEENSSLGPDEGRRLLFEERWSIQDPKQTVNFFPAHVLFYATSISMSIALMNILIGVLGQAYDVEEDRAEIAFLRQRAQTLAMIAFRPWWRCWPRRCSLRQETESSHPLLLLIMFRTEPPVDLRSLRSNLKAMERRIMAQQRKQVKRIEDMIRKCVQTK